MNYAEAIQFLYGLQMFGTHLGLETTRQLAALAGNPQTQLRFIHVAGTNGKGSTCAMLESIYRAAGLRVGLFTSPHLVSFRERMQVNRQLVSEAEVARLVDEVQALLKQFPADAHPTMFEVVTVMALKFFAEQKCDLVIWETGLGGRLDATNIVTPLASVITNIALDHTQWLGDTIEKIAAEKAGIIKRGVPVITAAREPALGVIEEVARKNKSSLARVEASAAGTSCPSNLLGEHQRQNAALAVAVVRVLQTQLPVDDATLRRGLEQIRWPGRFQVIEREPGRKVILDGAHNVAGAEVLRATLQNQSSGPIPVLILGVLADKDWHKMCEVLAPLAEKIIAVPVASARTVPAAELAAFLKNSQPKAEVIACDNVAAALATARSAPLTVVAGSLYLIGEALEVLGLTPGGEGERALNEWTFLDKGMASKGKA